MGNHSSIDKSTLKQSSDRLLRLKIRADHRKNGLQKSVSFDHSTLAKSNDCNALEKVMCIISDSSLSLDDSDVDGSSRKSLSLKTSRDAWRSEGALYQMAMVALAPASTFSDSSEIVSYEHQLVVPHDRHTDLLHGRRSKEFQHCIMTSLALLGISAPAPSPSDQERLIASACTNANAHTYVNVGEIALSSTDLNGVRSDAQILTSPSSDKSFPLQEHHDNNNNNHSSSTKSGRQHHHHPHHHHHHHHHHNHNHNHISQNGELHQSVHRSASEHHHHHHHHHHNHHHETNGEHDATTCSFERSASVRSHGADSADRCDSHDNSLCSSEENLSIDNSRQESARKAWRKLRHTIVWSPFVQFYKKKSYLWVQLAGHEGSFKPGKLSGTIMKKLCARESKCLQKLMIDALRPFVPEFKAEVVQDGETYLEMQDLLVEFEDASIMDCKLGTRTYLETELEKMRSDVELRPDMYKKMVEVDPDEPTPEEHAAGAITKVRYMQWREAASSSSTLGFRIEGMNRPKCRDFKQIRDWDDVKSSLRKFIDVPNKYTVLRKFIDRLQKMKEAISRSNFFTTHELIGTSLLFVYDHTSCASIWIIDFGKTVRIPEGMRITHNKPWIEGNHEDGYLIGFENMIKMFVELYHEGTTV